jgi:hypothetical protein
MKPERLRADGWRGDVELSMRRSSVEGSSQRSWLAFSITPRSAHGLGYLPAGCRGG